MEGGPADNLLLLVDSYKVSHYRQYPPGTTTVYSYFESRGGRFPYTVFFGLQYIIKRWLVGPVVTKEKIAEAKALLKLHFGSDIFNEEGWQYILEKHGGRIPLKISAVPEGSVIPTKNILFSVENTDPKLPWLTSFVETLLVQVWYPLTVATNSRIQKQIIHHYLTATHDNVDSLPFKLHDFGFRGATSVESAAIGGAAHLVNFKGTDTLASISLLCKAYHSEMPAFSIVASEHSTMTSWGKDREMDACRNMLEAYPSGSTIACVSDSYNIWECCEEIWGNHLKDLVVKRGEKGGVLLVRPDSGDPPSVVVRCLEILGKAFGTETNTKGFKLLPAYLRIVQGDGISYKTLGSVLGRMKEEGWSAENIVFGSGGALLQKVDRDTQKCAYKCSYVEINGKGHNVYKEPITDMGKKSKRGRLSLHRDDGNTFTTIEEGKGSPETDLLVPVFENGELLQDYTLEQVRTRAELGPLDIDILSFLKADGSSS